MLDVIEKFDFFILVTYYPIKSHFFIIIIIIFTPKNWVHDLYNIFFIDFSLLFSITFIIL